MTKPVKLELELVAHKYCGSQKATGQNRERSDRVKETISLLIIVCN
jgi:hypothetical protein